MYYLEPGMGFPLMVSHTMMEPHRCKMYQTCAYLGSRVFSIAHSIQCPFILSQLIEAYNVPA